MQYAQQLPYLKINFEKWYPDPNLDSMKVKILIKYSWDTLIYFVLVNIGANSWRWRTLIQYYFSSIVYDQMKIKSLNSKPSFIVSNLDIQYLQTSTS